MPIAQPEQTLKARTARASGRGLSRKRSVRGRTRVIAEALDHVAQTGIVYYEAELHRLDGELLQLYTPDEQRAETSFRRALGIARQQQAKSWELRACDEPSPSCGPNRDGGPKRASC